MFKYRQFSSYTTIGQNNFGNKIPMFFHAFFTLTGTYKLNHAMCMKNGPRQILKI